MNDSADLNVGAAPATRLAMGHSIRTVALRKGVFLEAIVVVNMLAVAVSMYTMQMYDRVVPNQGYATLYVLTTGVLLAALLEPALKHARASCA